MVDQEKLAENAADVVFKHGTVIVDPYLFNHWITFQLRINDDYVSRLKEMTDEALTQYLAEKMLPTIRSTLDLRNSDEHKWKEPQ